MKNNVLKVTIVTMFVLVVCSAVYTSKNQKVSLSDLAIENIEALAGDETGKVTCCPDPGDQCVLSSGDILKDQDEC